VHLTTIWEAVKAHRPQRKACLLGIGSIKRLQDGVKMDFRWKICKGGRWLELAEDRVPWRTFMITVSPIGSPLLTLSQKHCLVLAFKNFGV
jgi:hypothetical protein